MPLGFASASPHVGRFHRRIRSLDPFADQHRHPLRAGHDLEVMSRGLIEHVRRSRAARLGDQAPDALANRNPDPVPDTGGCRDHGFFGTVEPPVIRLHRSAATCTRRYDERPGSASLQNDARSPFIPHREHGVADATRSAPPAVCSASIASRSLSDAKADLHTYWITSITPSRRSAPTTSPAGRAMGRLKGLLPAVFLLFPPRVALWQRAPQALPARHRQAHSAQGRSIVDGG